MAKLASSQIVNCLALGIAITAVAGTASAMAGRKSPGMRFAIWFAALLAIASLFLAAGPVANGTATAHMNALSLRPEWALYLFGTWAFFRAIGLARVRRGLRRGGALEQRSQLPGPG